MAAETLTVELSVLPKKFILRGSEGQNLSIRRRLNQVFHLNSTAALRSSEIEFQLVLLVTVRSNF